MLARIRVIFEHTITWVPAVTLLLLGSLGLVASTGWFAPPIEPNTRRHASPDACSVALFVGITLLGALRLRQILKHRTST